MEPDLSMTKEAVDICTPDQFEAIKHLIADGNKRIRVFVDFSLPKGYLYFVVERQGNLHPETAPIHGGIDAYGSVST